MKNATFFIIAIVALLIVSLYFNAKYFSMKEDSLSLQLKPHEVKEIHGVMDKQLEAWNKGDIESFMEGYWKSDRLVFVGAAGPTYGWQPVKENYYKRYPDLTAMGKLQFTVIELSKLDENCAFQIGKFHLTRTIGNLEGYFSLIWKKIDGRWVVVSDHTTASTGN